MKNLLALTISLIFLASCQSEIANKSEEKGLSQKEIRLANIQSALSLIPESLTEFSGSPIHDWLQAYYTSDSLSFVWFSSDTLSSEGRYALELLSKHKGYGIPYSYGHKRLISLLDSMNGLELNNPVRAKLISLVEIGLSESFLSFTTDVSYGIFDENKRLKFKKDSLKRNPNFILEQVKTEGTIKAFKEEQPEHIKYKYLLKNLIDFTANFELSKDTGRVFVYKLDSVKSYTLAKELMIKQGWLDSSANDSLFLLTLQDFQGMYGLNRDGKIGLNTARALNMSNEERYLQAVLSLEKWRTKRDFTYPHVYVNVPAYELNFVKKDSITRVHRVVAGAPYTPTPSFSAKLKYLTLFPYWHVPYSISSKEILPKLKEDPAYLAQHGYQLFSKDRQSVDANAVDWNSVSQGNFPYRIRQNGGSYNSLGLVAFMFPNEHSVFIHDTPSKIFFKNDMRAYSHGCVRLQDPLDLATYILGMDQPEEFSRDSLDTLIQHRVETRIYLKNPFDVHIQYHTAEGKEDGIKFYLDIYGREAEDKKAIRKLLEEVNI
jgi:murein L,D-transpeptidase YcbB/YkuD